MMDPQGHEIFSNRQNGVKMILHPIPRRRKRKGGSSLRIAANMRLRQQEARRDIL
jgi:hypothetical protein